MHAGDEEFDCPIAQAASLNNVAVDWIDSGTRGKLDSAHLLLSTALSDSTLFKRTGVIAPVSVLDDHDNPSLMSFSIVRRSASRRAMPCSPDEQHTLLCSTDELNTILSKYFHDASQYQQDERAFQRFTHPLTVDMWTAVHRQSEDFVRATMLYNLAQLIHTQASKTCRRSLLEQAECLYRVATLTLVRAVECDLCTEREVAPLLLAIWNNRAYIRCYQMVDYGMAERLMQEMNRFLHTSVKELLKQPGPHMHSDHYFFFYMNVMMNENGGLFQSASAA